ncbi:MAG: hypothetical protein O2857_20375 [Planctomycetota bacterium]|nr:hypothetical protein [Planctomycetota bacterium]
MPFLFGMQVLAASVFAQELILEPVPFWNGKIREGRWTGAHLFLTNQGKKPRTLIVDAWLSKTTFDDVRYRKFIQLPVGSIKRVPFYLRSGFMPEEMNFECRDAETGERINSVALQVSSMVSPVHMAVMGRPIPFFSETSFSALLGGSAENTSDALSLTRLDMLPERSEGLDSLDILVIGEQPLDALNPRQIEAILGWVGMGGNLVLVPGRFWQSLENKFPLSLLPARNFRAVDDLTEKQGAPAANEAIRFQFEPVIEPESRSGSGGVTLCRWLRGRGAVSLLTCSPALLAEMPRADVRKLWKGVVRLGSKSSDEQSQNYAYLKPETALSSLLASRGSGGSIGFGWALLFVVVYLCIIGPGDMLLVRKLKRPVLTWVTFPLMVAVFSGLSYWRAYSTKAGPMMARQLSIVDVSPLRKVRHIRTWTNVFSQQNRYYQLRTKVEGGFWCAPGDLQTQASGIGDRTIAVQENQEASIKTNIPIWTSRLMRVDHTVEGDWLKATVDEHEVNIELNAEPEMTLTHCTLIHGDEVVRLPDKLIGGGKLIFPRKSDSKLQSWLSALAQNGGQLPRLGTYGYQQWNEEQAQRMLYLLSFRSQWDPNLAQKHDRMQNDSYFDLSEISKEGYCFLAWANRGAINVDYVDEAPRLIAMTLVRFCFGLDPTEESKE